MHATETTRANRRDKKAATPPPQEPSVSYQVSVTHPKLCRPGQVYPVSIDICPLKPMSSSSSNTGFPVRSVLMRLVVPGALVSPSEQFVDVTDMGGYSMFHITPLAEGQLPSARVEIVRQGRVAQRVELRLACQRRRHARLVAMSVLLTILVPISCHLPVMFPNSEFGVSFARAFSNVPPATDTLAAIAQSIYDFLGTTAAPWLLGPISFGLLLLVTLRIALRRDRLGRTTTDGSILSPETLRLAGPPPFLSPVNELELSGLDRRS